MRDEWGGGPLGEFTTGGEGGICAIACGSMHFPIYERSGVSVGLWVCELVWVWLWVWDCGPEVEDPAQECRVLLCVTLGFCFPVISPLPFSL